MQQAPVPWRFVSLGSESERTRISKNHPHITTPLSCIHSQLFDYLERRSKATGPPPLSLNSCVTEYSQFWFARIVRGPTPLSRQPHILSCFLHVTLQQIASSRSRWLTIENAIPNAGRSDRSLAPYNPRAITPRRGKVGASSPGV